MRLTLEDTFNPEELRIRRGAAHKVMLGVLVTAAAYSAIMSVLWSQTGRWPAPLGYDIVAGIFGSILLFVGLDLVFERSGVDVDRTLRTVTTWTSHLGLRREWVHELDDSARIVCTRYWTFVRIPDRDAGYRYRVTLHTDGPDTAGVALAEDLREDEARRCAAHLAEFLAIPVAEVGGRAPGVAMGR